MFVVVMSSICCVNIAIKIIVLIHALRNEYNLNGKLRDPMNDHPFQPGSRVITGRLCATTSPPTFRSLLLVQPRRTPPSVFPSIKSFG